MVTSVDLSYGNGISLSEAATLLPRKNGKKLHVMTIKRWIIQGCRGVRLEGRRIGNDWFTTPEALVQFQVDCTASAMVTENRITPDRRIAVSAVRERLRKNGFYRTSTKGSSNGTEVNEEAAGQVPAVRS